METIKLNNGQLIDCMVSLVEITIGDYSGYWAREDDSVTLYSGEIGLIEECDCIDGDYYHPEEFDTYDIVYDNYLEEYSFMNDCYYGYLNNGEMGYFSTDSDYVYFNDTYYINERVAERHEIYYCCDCGEHYYSDNGCDCDEEDENHDDYCFNYHSGNRKDISGDSVYKIGFEVEKEDSEIKSLSYANNLFQETKWAKETDGSLDKTGFELISPVFPLDIKTPLYSQKVITDSIELVKSHINADYSRSCGGHINISQQGLSSKELLETISGYLPLFYSIYQNRVGNTYAKAQSLKIYLGESDKYRAFNAKYNGVLEIRIFPAVKNVENLLWRAELLRLILHSPTNNHKKALENISNPNNELHQHLRKVFTPIELLKKVKLFLMYAKQYDKANIKQQVINRSIVKILKVA